MVNNRLLTNLPSVIIMIHIHNKLQILSFLSYNSVSVLIIIVQFEQYLVRRVDEFSNDMLSNAPRVVRVL